MIADVRHSSDTALMKVYGIFPVIELVKLGRTGNRVQECISLVATLATELLRSGGDTFHFAVDWRDPGSDPDDTVYHDDMAEPHIDRLNTAEILLPRVRKSVDPFDSAGATIRSIATCRAATFGYDGQVFICLRHEDPQPISPDLSLITIEERPDILVDCDYFDGSIRPIAGVPG